MNTDYKVICLPGRRHAYEHRVVWERHFGAIPDGHHVHHKNGDKRDNRIENLELLNAHEHHKHHFTEHGATQEHKTQAALNLSGAWARMPILKLKCVVCDSDFEKKQHITRGAAKYCSPRCRGKDYYETKTKSRLKGLS